MGVIGYSPMQKGLLTGKVTPEWVSELPPDDHRKKDPMFLEPELEINEYSISQLKAVAEEHGKALSQLAVAWVLRRKEMTSAIVGARKKWQIEETAPAGEWFLSDETIDRIEIILEERKNKLSEISNPFNPKAVEWV